MESIPSILLLDIHCPSASELKRQFDQNASGLPSAFRAILEKASRAQRLKAEVLNEHDGLVTTKTELEALTGTEAEAKAARDLSVDRFLG